MKIHFNNIRQQDNKYIYEYHTQKSEKITSTFGYFALAGLIGSFKVVSEKGWFYLVPFWIIVFILSKLIDWFINIRFNQNTPIKIQFVSKYPHYVLEDILWMLKITNQNFLFGEIITKASEEFGQEIDIQIGKLSAMKIGFANFSSETLRHAIEKQEKLEQEWSKNTGLDYPDLGMPKR